MILYTHAAKTQKKTTAVQLTNPSADDSRVRHGFCCNLTKGYWMKNNQNGGWK